MFLAQNECISCRKHYCDGVCIFSCKFRLHVLFKNIFTSMEAESLFTMYICKLSISQIPLSHPPQIFYVQQSSLCWLECLSKPVLGDNDPVQDQC
ncbi:hypothetical protein FKM82_008457 [Ascaphus truei]